MVTSRRRFISQLGAAGALARFGSLRFFAEPATPFPYVDGLTLNGSFDKLPASGLSAFLVDVSQAEQLKTTDGLGDIIAAAFERMED